MWFDIVKINIANLKTLQGDADAKEINIPESNKCKERIIRFERNLYREFYDGVWFNVQGMKPEIPEKVYCWIVEQLDKFFNADFIKDGKREINNLDEDFNSTPDRYEIELYSSRRPNAPDNQDKGTPLVFRLYRGSSDKPLIYVSFYSLSGLKETNKRYNDIKSCWERA